MRWRNALIAVAILLLAPLGVKAAEADQPVALTLDSGFVGRAVLLELFEGRLTVRWDKGTLVKPTVIRVRPGVAATGTRQTVAGDAWSITFDDADAVSGAGKIGITARAHRPPSSDERAELNAAVSSTALVTTNAFFGGRTITGTIAAAASVTVTPAWGDGVMRQGVASWYAYKKCLCAASPDVPKGTRLLVSREDDPSRSVVVTVNDWGPERDKHPDRAIDLDKVAFKRIGNPRGGLMRVRVELIPRNDPRWKLGDEIPPPNWKKLLANVSR
ncbi:MAG TPA: septal ring lytic transglycosylase RlpA family protein [Candidatus Methylomirabilis sp.]|nr:septal ring lytic transglycosylase RlpA family protein [Candidatus Methylomirabilis sp.]